MPHLTLAAGIVIVAFLGAVGLMVVLLIARGKIDLSMLVSEKGPPGDQGPPAASLSRFQFLIFTFVIAMCFLVLTLDSGQFPTVDPTVLGLLGISGGSYVVSKAIQKP